MSPVSLGQVGLECRCETVLAQVDSLSEMRELLRGLGVSESDAGVHVCDIEMSSLRP